MKEIDLTQLSDEQFEAEMKRREQEKQKKANEQREAYDALKTETVVTLSDIAKAFSKDLKEFKTNSFEAMQTMYAMLQEYSSRYADGKGNFRLEVGDYRVSYRRQGRATFDEKAYQAEKHIIDFINSKFSNEKDTKDFIMAMLERKKGELDINLIQKLYAMEDRFDDENWKKGISLLKESYQYSHSKDYILFEERNANGDWQNINLQFSNL